MNCDDENINEIIELLKEMKENCAKATREKTKNQYRDEKAPEKYIALDYAINSINELNKCKKLLDFKNKYCRELEKDLFENSKNYVIPKKEIEEIILKLEENQRYHIETKADEIIKMLKIL